MTEEGVKNTRKDIIDLIAEKDFLGKEFLTWLWFRSDSGRGVVTAYNGVDIAVTFERFIMLESGRGDSEESVTCRGLQASLSEGISALASGKKVSRAHIRIGTGEYDWKLTISGSTFDISSLKVPKTVQAGHEEHEDLSYESRVLERGFMILAAIKTMDELFYTFLRKRLSDDEWPAEKQGINQWIMKRAKGERA